MLCETPVNPDYEGAGTCHSPVLAASCGVFIWRGIAVRRRIDIRRQDGVAMTEFALIIPVFLVVVAGLLGFGRVFFYWIGANHLANETARWVVVDRNPNPAAFPNPDALQKYARANGGSSSPAWRNEGLHQRPRRRISDDRRPDRGQDLEAVHDGADPRRRHDHDPGDVGHAHRAIRETRPAPRRRTTTPARRFGPCT